MIVPEGDSDILLISLGKQVTLDEPSRKTS